METDISHICRMFVVENNVNIVDGTPEMDFDIVGSTGNIYKTVIKKAPTCSCMDCLKGNQCKHICYGKMGSSFSSSSTSFFFFFFFTHNSEQPN